MTSLIQDTTLTIDWGCASSIPMLYSRYNFDHRNLVLTIMPSDLHEDAIYYFIYVITDALRALTGSSKLYPFHVRTHLKCSVTVDGVEIRSGIPDLAIALRMPDHTFRSLLNLEIAVSQTAQKVTGVINDWRCDFLNRGNMALIIDESSPYTSPKNKPTDEDRNARMRRTGSGEQIANNYRFAGPVDVKIIVWRAGRKPWSSVGKPEKLSIIALLANLCYIDGHDGKRSQRSHICGVPGFGCRSFSAPLRRCGAKSNA